MTVEDTRVEPAPESAPVADAPAVETQPEASGADSVETLRAQLAEQAERIRLAEEERQRDKADFERRLASLGHPVQTAQPTTDTGPDPRFTQQRIMEYERLAKEGNPDAQVMLEVIQSSRRAELNSLLATVPVEDQPYVRTLLETGRVNDIDTARLVVDGARKRVAEQQTAKDKAALGAASAVRITETTPKPKPAVTVAGDSIRPMGASEVKKIKMTWSEYDARLQKLGWNSKEAQDLVKRATDGEIERVPG